MMFLSARNQLKAVVKKVKAGAVNNEVTLALEGGTEITSVITQTSCENLGIKEGTAAYAVIKASNVMIGEDGGGLKLSARNQLCGTIEAVVKGAVNAEVSITLTGGEKLVSIITLTSAERMKLAAGVQVKAVIKASDIMIGVE